MIPKPVYWGSNGVCHVITMAESHPDEEGFTHGYMYARTHAHTHTNAHTYTHTHTRTPDVHAITQTISPYTHTLFLFLSIQFIATITTSTIIITYQ